MPAPKMAVFVSLVMLAGAFATGALGLAPFSNAASTETAAPQELGSLTSAGSLVYSLNMCTIVHSTICQTSMSTGGAAPPAAQPSPGSEGPSSAGSATASAAASQPAASSPPQPAPTVLTTTNAEGSPTVLTQGTLSATPTGEATQSPPTQSEEKQQPSSSTAVPLPTSTGAGNAVGLVRPVAIVAGVMALACLL